VAAQLAASQEGLSSMSEWVVDEYHELIQLCICGSHDCYHEEYCLQGCNVLHFEARSARFSLELPSKCLNNTSIKK
jgi:hypothetical protein